MCTSKKTNMHLYNITFETEKIRKKLMHVMNSAIYNIKIFNNTKCSTKNKNVRKFG